MMNVWKIPFVADLQYWEMINQSRRDWEVCLILYALHGSVINRKNFNLEFVR